MLKIKIKTDLDKLNALVLILRCINITELEKADFTTYAMKMECVEFVFKLIQNPAAKSVKLPTTISIALYYFYEAVMPSLGVYEQTVYREIINEMELFFRNVNVRGSHLLLK